MVLLAFSSMSHFCCQAHRPWHAVGWRKANLCPIVLRSQDYKPGKRGRFVFVEPGVNAAAGTDIIRSVCYVLLGAEVKH